jgi:hypothetical protein
MATILYKDINKRNNAATLIGYILNGVMMLGGSGEGKIVLLKPYIKIGNTEIEVKPENKKNTTQALDRYCMFSQNKSIFLQSVTGEFIRLTKFFKTHELAGKKFGSRSGFKDDTERQEVAMVNTINQITKNLPVKIDFIPHKIARCEKVEGVNSLGQKPYSDIYLISEYGKRYNVSCKGSNSPSLAGGGLKSLKLIVPDLLERFFKNVREDYADLGYYQGMTLAAKDIKDMYYEIPSEFVKKIIVGTPEMGGPIEYMYIGPMNEVLYNPETCSFNGRFVHANIYSNNKFYIRLRQRDSLGKFLTIDFSKKGIDGFPVIHRHNLVKTSRIVITDQSNVPLNSINVRKIR